MFLKNDHKYDDIINMQRPISKKHKPMSLYARSCQFAPYSALTGYSDLVTQTAKQTEEEYNKEPFEDIEDDY